MNTELAEMRQRQDGFGMRLTTLEEQVEAEASMRAAMAQHISDIKTEQLAQRGLLQALGQTQGEQNARSVRVEGKLMGIDDRLTTLTGRVVGMDDRLTNVETRLGGVETRLDRVEQGLGTVQVGVQTIIAILDRQIDEQPEAAGN